MGLVVLDRRFAVHQRMDSQALGERKPFVAGRALVRLARRIRHAGVAQTLTDSRLNFVNVEEVGICARP
jgi:hypothetical protein